MNLRASVIVQIVLIAGLDCILIPSAVKEDRTVVPRLGRASTWETVLRQAAYQSLSKYTAFTDSLDEKIQRDQILWSKIHVAHVQRTNKQDGDINIKTGTLVDEPSGIFEFRREKSIQSCTSAACLDNSKLLAIWKIQRIKPNHLVVRMKVTLHPSTEDVYQYTPSLGLKLQTSKEVSKIQSTTYLPEIIEIPKKNKSIAFPDQIQGNPRKLPNLYKAQQSQDRPVSLYYVPTEQLTQSHVIFPQTSNVLSSHDLIAQHNTKDRYGLNSQTVKAILSEFQHDKGYDGFLPSMGPTENPLNLFKSTTSLNQYKPELKGSVVTTSLRGTYKTFKQTTPANFKPSTHFVQYSEQDPFYYSQTTEFDKTTNKGHYENKPQNKDIYFENTKLPVKESLVGNRKIPIKELYVDTFKFPPKGSYWDNKEYPKEVFVSTGRPFQMTALKESLDSTINHQAFTTPNYLGNSFNKGQKYPVHVTTPNPQYKYQKYPTSAPDLSQYQVHKTTPTSNLKFQQSQESNRDPSTISNIQPQKFQRGKVQTTQIVTNKYPLVVTTQNDNNEFPNQETMQKYPVAGTTEGPNFRYSITATPQTSVFKFPAQVTRVETPHENSPTGTFETKLPETVRNNIKVTTEEKIIESIESDEHKSRTSTTARPYHRRRPIRNRKPVRKQETQEIGSDSSGDVAETRHTVYKHPTSINEQLLALDSNEKETSFETGTNNLSGEKESTEEVRETATTTTTEVPTTTKLSRKYNRKTNRNWNYTRNSVGKNRTKSRGSTYFSRWGEKVRNTSESPTRLRSSYRTKETTTTTTTTTTELPLIENDSQTEEYREDSEVYESQTVSSIELAPVELTQTEEITTTPTTKKEELTTTTISGTETTLIETTPYPTTVFTQDTTETQDKYRNKTPEEIVNELTALGLRNSSQIDETTTQKSTVPQKSPDLVSRLQAGQYRGNLDDNETSLVVNRVSKSVSFKTARGLSGRIMQPTNILAML